jgi:hypothetical protein
MHSSSPHQIFGSRLWPVVAACGVLLASVWYAQNTSIGRLDARVKQLRQEISKLPESTPTPVRLNLTKEEIELEAERVKLQNSLHNTLFQGAGIATLLGLIYRYLRRQEEERGNRGEIQMTDRLDRAIEHLASDKQEIRLGGIYALERIAEESPSERWTVIEVLSSFVRAKSYAQREHIRAQQRASQRQISVPRIPTDVQAAISVISRRDVSGDRSDRTIELRETYLRAADLVGSDLGRADLWRANLSDAQLWQAKLADAFLGKANFTNASLWQADLRGAYLWQANLQDTNLEDANLIGANLEDANFAGANLKGAKLGLADLRSAKGLTREQIESAVLDDNTQLPDYLA